MNKTNQPITFQKFYDKQLTTDDVAEMKFNFVNYIEMLIEMDKQHIVWLEEQRIWSNSSGRNGGENGVETAENTIKEENHALPNRKGF